jgi:two-component system response regulator PilR (NtrC family)
VDVRILSATHKNLSTLVGQGLFRQDLFYRINVIELVVPALRERRADIPILIHHLLGKLTRSNGDLPAEISQTAIAALMRYEFPGNVRELENILERAVALCEGRIISVEDLDLPKSAHQEAIVDVAPGSMVLETGMTLENYMDEVEKRAIEQVLNKTRWNRTAAARELGITFRALRYKLKKLGLE